MQMQEIIQCVNMFKYEINENEKEKRKLNNNQNWVVMMNHVNANEIKFRMNKSHLIMNIDVDLGS